MTTCSQNQPPESRTTDNGPQAGLICEPAFLTKVLIPTGRFIWARLKEWYEWERMVK